MKKYQAGSIRNVCLLSHGGVGKTSLLEASCFTAKATSKLGKVDNGSSIFDSRPDEKERKITISTHLGYCEWNDTKINFLDTPGFLDLLGEAKSALRVVETAVILVDGVSGVQVGTELVTSYLEGTETSRVIFVNGMDKENADFQKVLDQLKQNFGSGVAPLVIPISAGPSFKGVIDLVAKEAYTYTPDGNGIGNKIEIPADMSAQVDSLRQALMESVAETDEELMNAYFEKGELSDQEIRNGLAKGVQEGNIYPLLSGSATLNIGVDQLLTKIVNLCPAASTRTSVTVIENDEEKQISCDEKGPAAAFVFKSISEEHLGEINLIRVFSGNIQSGMELNNPDRGNIEKMGSMFYLREKRGLRPLRWSVVILGGY